MVTIKVPTNVLRVLIDIADELAQFKDQSSYRETCLRNAEQLLMDHRAADVKAEPAKEEVLENSAYGSW